MLWLLTLAAPLLMLLLYDLVMCLLTYLQINERRGKNARKASKRSIIPSRITLWHSFAFMGQKWSYELHIFYAVFYALRMNTKKLLGWRCIEVTQEDVVNFLLNTALVIYTDVVEESVVVEESCIAGQSGLAEFTLDMRDFWMHLEASNNGMNRLHVTYKVCKPKEGEKLSGCVTSFVLNGNAVTCPSAQLSILLIAISVAVHPLVHSFFEDVYEQREHPNAKKYGDLFLHGQYLNHRANYYSSYLLGVNPDMFLQCLLNNTRKDIPAHGFCRMSRFAKYSRLVRFLLGARQAVKIICRDYRLPVPAEHLFISSVLHAADHYSIWKNVKDRNLSLKCLETAYHPYLHLYSAFIVAPSQHIFSNLLKSKQSKTDAYASLYGKLSALDQEYADIVTLSISY